MKYPQALQELIESFQKYPGVGPKTAERMALYTVLDLSEYEVSKLSQGLMNSKKTIRRCQICSSLTEQDICEICQDDTRDKTILVIESNRDMMAVEKTNQYHGYYHVLNGVISPLEGIGPDDLNLSGLYQRVIKGNIGEIIIATNATVEGETTALYITKIFEDSDILITRIGYGLPVGGDIEYADEITLMKSLEGRRKIE